MFLLLPLENKNFLTRKSKKETKFWLNTNVGVGTRLYFVNKTGSCGYEPRLLSRSRRSFLSVLAGLTSAREVSKSDNAEKTVIQVRKRKNLSARHFYHFPGYHIL